MKQPGGALSRIGRSWIWFAALVAIASAANAAPLSQRDADALAKASYVYIATVRKSGDQSRNTPVWFTTTDAGEVLIETGPQSWKAKRIRRGSPAMIWIGKADGPAFIGKAEITNDHALQDQVIADYPVRYFAARMGFAKPTREKFDQGQIVAIRIKPVRDLPDGFANSPGTPAPPLTEKTP